MLLINIGANIARPRPHLWKHHTPLLDDRDGERGEVVGRRQMERQIVG